MNHNRPGGPVEVPMAEDNPDDVSLTQEALEGPKLCINPSVVENGEEAMAFGTCREA